MQITRNTLETAAGPGAWFTGTIRVTEGMGLPEVNG